MRIDDAGPPHDRGAAMRNQAEWRASLVDPVRATLPASGQPDLNAILNLFSRFEGEPLAVRLNGC